MLFNWLDWATEYRLEVLYPFFFLLLVLAQYNPSLLIEDMSGIPFANRLVGLVVKASASRAEDPGFESRLRRDLFGVESYQ